MRYHADRNDMRIIFGIHFGCPQERPTFCTGLPIKYIAGSKTVHRGRLMRQRLPDWRQHRLRRHAHQCG